MRKILIVSILLISSFLSFGQTNSNDLVKKQGYISKPYKLYFKWDKYDLIRSFLSNDQVLNSIDSLMNLRSRLYIDSISISSYASPEGGIKYNQRLSEKRGKSIKNYLLLKYPNLEETQIRIDAKGENWQELKEMVISDTLMPMRDEVLKVVNDSKINDSERQRRIQMLDRGRLYRNYILPNYYRYLRSGSSIFIVYSPSTPIGIDTLDIKELDPAILQKDISRARMDSIIRVSLLSKMDSIAKIDSLAREGSLPKRSNEDVLYNYVISYPIAIKTNLLYDVLGGLNIGVEVPINKFSLIAQAAHSYWRTSNYLFAFQLLEYGLEARYWFGTNKNKENWNQPLKGWNVGVYGHYLQRYDVQFKNGFQGDDTWTLGLSGGYSFPISKALSLEASLGVGYFDMKEYRKYNRPEYMDNKYHLMWEKTSKLTGLSLTKLEFNLVWLLQYKRKELINDK